MNKCLRCFKDFSNSDACPFCGYKEGTAVQEPHYLIPGIVLQQRYVIGTAVGAGGFGVTYAAWDQVLNQKVAIKEYMPGEFTTRTPGETQVTVYGGEKTEQFQQGKEKFSEESRRLAAFHNIPGIVQIFNTFHENGTVYIVMEFLEGETLEERLKRDNKIEPKEAVEMMLMILQALETVHKEGILHRDIAPNNIFLTKDGEVKLLDFGAARSMTGTHSKSLTVLYKEGYTPEEQYRSRGDQGPWTDVYACAATLYRMLTGEVPPGSLERRMKDTLMPPVKKNAKISHNVSTAVMNALNVDTNHRTRSAEQFRKELTGEIKSKKHYRRTVERRIGKMPTAVKIGTAVSLLAIVAFAFMLETGVIHVNASAFESVMLPEGKTRVPNIVNNGVYEAQESLAERYLEIKIIDKQFSDEIPKDKILTQSLNAGAIVDQGDTIEVVISGGSKNRENDYELQDGETFVPDVQYKDLEEAVALIEEAGMTAEVKYELNDIVDVGKVTRQELESGSVVLKGDKLIFYLSSEDYVIQWEDNAFETMIREYLGKEEEDIYWSDVWDIKELEIHGDSIGPRARETTSGYNISTINDMRHFIFIENLEITFNNIDDISGLSDLKNLRSLDLSENNNISDISALDGLKNLEILTLHENNISDISALSGLTNLRSLSLDGNNISDISALSGLTNLRNLGLGGNDISDVSALSGLTNLESLHLYENNISNVNALSELTNLWDLSIFDNNISDVSALSSLTNLIILDLSENNISDISTLGGLTNLESLTLYENNISNVSALSELTNLKFLGLDGNNISDIGV